ncbi:hypothetical protein [Psychroflexus halocasei]|uniref:CRISPR-associated protein Csh1 n=1 Tax=Psychroflexus halocasei TaxID=908615 RepID=A0A1H4CHT9_9FLAO|nr:hypothetical protein [Psychroflexus halocasei]SEA59908.1 CRISPR-associated protein Csh1 [Psychroflexus halocasei]
MIKELVNFTDKLEEPFKILGYEPKPGLHILVNKTQQNGTSKIDLQDFHYEKYDKKMKQDMESDFLEDCKLRQKNSWCVNTNKCFDLPTKAIHSCSPFCVAFKREHLEGGKKYKQYEGNEKKPQIYDRFKSYFEKAFSLFNNEEEKEKYIVFERFFSNDDFSEILREIDDNQRAKEEEINSKIKEIQENAKATSDKSTKKKLKEQAKVLKHDALQFKELSDQDYVIFYLDVPLKKYKEVHDNYLSDKLFNTTDYNIEDNQKELTYGTSDFLNGFNSKMPFLMHQTASFDISGRISNKEAKSLYEFLNILPNRSLPSPLPIFIYEEELQSEAISLFKESGFKYSYTEILKELFKNHNDKEIANYYLLYWLYTKNGVVFKDFDFVSKFEFKVDSQKCRILNLFGIKKNDKNQMKTYQLDNIFDFESLIFKQLLQNKYLKLDYFGELKKDDYTGFDLSFSSYSKYRKAVYDYVYKSKRQAISYHTFQEMVFARLKDNLKQDNEYGIKEILNIWFSLAEFFINPKNPKITMPSKLKSYREFVKNLVSDEEAPEVVSNEEFAFTAGQVIKYIHSKSKSADSGFGLLEPYTQQSKCDQFKLRIANDFERYKHENFSRNFERAASFILSFETEIDLKKLLPEMLAGFFNDNKLFSNSKNEDQ